MNENFFKKLKSIPKATKLSFKIKNMIGKGKEYDYILAVLLQEIPNSTEEQIKKILDPFWEQNKPDTSSEDNISNQLDNLLSQEKLKENMKNQTEKARWAKLADLPKKETKQQLDENIGGIVGIEAINQITHTPTDYEMAFEHYLGEMYDPKAAERDDADHIDALEKDMEYNAIKEDEEDFDYVAHDYEKLKSFLTSAAKTAKFNIPRADNIDLEDMSQNLERYIDKLDEIGGFEKFIEEGLDDLLDTGSDVRDRMGLRLDSPVSRIEGVANTRDLQTMKDMLRILSAEWMQEGFEKEDIQDYITDFINKI